MKTQLKKIAYKLGNSVIKLNKQKRPVPQGKSVHQGFTSERIKLIGEPKTVVDVGVAGGTFELYNAFPQAHLVLVEPLPDLHRDTINTIKERYEKVTLLPVAAGTRASIADINVEMAALGKSSMLKRTELTKERSGTEKRTIKVERLDKLLESGAYPSPFAVKIDTEGFELNVVRGATEILSHIEFFIAEVSVAKRFESSYTFSEFIEYMNDIGFEVTDMLSFSRTDPVGTRFLDLVFKRKK